MNLAPFGFVNDLDWHKPNPKTAPDKAEQHFRFNFEVVRGNGKRYQAFKLDQAKAAL